jgi:hypothetical protein
LEQVGEERLGPHRGIGGGRERVEHDDVRLGELACGGLGEQGGEVGEVHVPLDGLGTVLEGAVVVLQEALEVRFVARQVTERFAVLEREGERVEGVIEAEQVDWAGDGTSCVQGGDRVGGSAEADIPEDEFARVTLEALGQAELPDIQRLGFDDRTDHGMKGFAMGEGMDAVRAVGELNESVAGGSFHGRTFVHGATEAKLKERVPPELWRTKAVGRDLAPPARTRVILARVMLPPPLNPGYRPPFRTVRSGVPSACSKLGTDWKLACWWRDCPSLLAA